MSCWRFLRVMHPAERDEKLSSTAAGIFMITARNAVLTATEFGAFADDHRDRNELGRFARARAKEKHGREFAASEIDVIGDTPRDIACGKALGARTIAVATGRWSRDELANYEPDFLIDDLSKVETIIKTLGW